MNKKLIVAAGLLMLLLSIALKMMISGNQRSRTERIWQESKRGSERISSQRSPNAYILTVYAEYDGSDSPTIIYDGFATKVYEILSQHFIAEPINLRLLRGSNEGNFGKIVIRAKLYHRIYRKTSTNQNEGSQVLYRIEMKMDIDGEQKLSNWDGSHSLTIQKEPPSTVRSQAVYGVIEEHERKLLRKLFEQLVEQEGRFSAR